MSALYGTLKGARGMATRCGHSELTTHSACWDGAVRVDLKYDKKTKKTTYSISLVPWQGTGESRQIADGIFGESVDQTTTKE